MDLNIKNNIYHMKKYIIPISFSLTSVLTFLIEAMELKMILANDLYSKKDLYHNVYKMQELWTYRYISNLFLWKSIMYFCWEYAEVSILLELYISLLVICEFYDNISLTGIDFIVQAIKIVIFIIYKNPYRQYIVWSRNRNLVFPYEQTELLKVRNRYIVLRSIFYFKNIVIYVYLTIFRGLVWIIPLCIITVLDSFIQACSNYENIELRKLEAIYAQVMFLVGIFLLLVDYDIYTYHLGILMDLGIEEGFFTFLNISYMYFLYQDTKNFGKITNHK